MIPFNKPYLSGNELAYIEHVIQLGKISGNGYFTNKCHNYLESRYGFKKCLLTTSGTDALEMAAILTDIQPGDEVIMPSFTFVSTANAFVLRGAKIIFADSLDDHPNMDPEHVKQLITPKTKVIVPVHYAGVSCNMDIIMELANSNGILVVEDAAQGIESFYGEKPLGSIGHLAAFSFHETKNIISGEGGMLVVNDEKFLRRSEIIWEKGTNRVDFQKGKINKYGWVDVGSSFLPSELNAAYLYAQLENLDDIQLRRILLFNAYYTQLLPLKYNHSLQLPDVPDHATNNGHMFYILLKNKATRTRLISYLAKKDIQAVFHYLPLHQSEYFMDQYSGRPLTNSIRFSDSLLRLPLYYQLKIEQVKYITEAINGFFESVESS